MPSRRVQIMFIATGILVTRGASALGQTPPLVFTLPAPDVTTTVDVRTSTVVAERALALWSGSASDFGIGVDVAGRTWTIHSVTSMHALTSDGHSYPTFTQIEAGRQLWSRRSTTIAGGFGIRQEWDGTQVLIGRALGRAVVAGGRVQGSVVIERAVSTMRQRDAVDMVTTFGWSRRLQSRLAVGVEAIGQDLEGFWETDEAEGGARLLLGPSLHVQTRDGSWSASVTAGPVIQTVSTLLPSVTEASRSGRRGFGVFASATWLPSRR
jgi:hypothetical protein